jgi:hypothetical protein
MYCCIDYCSSKENEDYMGLGLDGCVERQNGALQMVNGELYMMDVSDLQFVYPQLLTTRLCYILYIES